jgi:hypothetical protein
MCDLEDGSREGRLALGISTRFFKKIRRAGTI